jgi:hypothetical protein
MRKGAGCSDEAANNPIGFDSAFGPHQANDCYVAGIQSAIVPYVLHCNCRDAVYAVDGKTYPMYLIFHGVDHLFHTSEPADKVAVGTVFSW